MNPSVLIVVSFIASLQLALGSVVAQAETTSPASAWNFDREQPGTLPSEFSIGTLFDGRPAGDWQVLATDRAKSPPHVFAQVMAKGAEHAYKVVLIKEVIASDLNLAVSFLPIQGQADMGGGLIWRAADDPRQCLTIRDNTSRLKCLEARVGKPIPAPAHGAKVPSGVFGN